MASIFNSLYVGYTGLNAAQVGISTTGHNIANAEVECYTRQRVVTSAATPISITPGQVGNGTEVTEIKRVFDSYSNTSPVSGDNTLALNMLQHQFENFDFYVGQKSYETTYGAAAKVITTIDEMMQTLLSIRS